jgi:hypothetical protein
MLGLQRSLQRLSQLPLVFDDEDAHNQHGIEVRPLAASLTQNVRELSGETAKGPH